jgi:hypothetical protein
MHNGHIALVSLVDTLVVAEKRAFEQLWNYSTV